MQREQERAHCKEAPTHNTGLASKASIGASRTFGPTTSSRNYSALTSLAALQRFLQAPLQRNVLYSLVASPALWLNPRQI